ncbi:aminoacyl-tRNA hydrolase [Candidatus Saccharibacteria bacterium]|jgi:PTH1 family peptidyl-tRNA hydrolase|nr:aminoacyl-tRNA hydrolase [Candidatus Saccharibacteria bacterium]
MGLIRERPEIGDSIPAYTIGSSTTLLIVGLGNVGDRYDGTRHNIGFECVDALASSQGFDSWITKRDLKCHITSTTIGGNKVILCKPTTLMNLSGESVQAVMNFYKIPAGKVLVVHDELDIDFGLIRTRIGGGSAGHNGIKSVTQHCGEAYGRMRVGIGPKVPEQIDSADFVLSKFKSTEQSNIKNLLQESTAILTEYIHTGGSLTPDSRSFLL